MANPLSWSYSRAETLEKCPRRYYYTYYPEYIKVHLNDWDLYLKVLLYRNLTNINMWKGEMTHSCISKILLEVNKNKGNPEDYAENILKITEERAVRQFAGSRRKDYKKYDKNNKWGLLEQALGMKLNFNEIFSDVSTNIYAFLQKSKEDDVLKNGIDKLKVLRNNIQDYFLEDPDIAEWDLRKVISEDIPYIMFIIPDFYYKSRENSYVIFDWKTGEIIQDSENIPKQIMAYAFRIYSNLNSEEKGKIKIYGYYYYLPGGEKTGGFVNPEDLPNFKNVIKQDIKKMESFIEDEDGIRNIPKDLDEFPLNLNECESCVFRILCGTVSEE